MENWADIFLQFFQSISQDTGNQRHFSRTKHSQLQGSKATEQGKQLLQSLSLTFCFPRTLSTLSPFTYLFLNQPPFFYSHVCNLF